MKNENKPQKMSGKIIILAIGAALGLFLLILGSGIGQKINPDKKDNTESPEGNYDAEIYRTGLEKSIAALCSQVKGAGNVTVSVCVDGSYKAVYAQNIQSGGTSGTVKNEYVLTGSGSSEAAVLIGYSPPQIIGIGIVCTGGTDAATRQELISLVAAAYGVPTNKIYVAGAKS